MKHHFQRQGFSLIEIIVFVMILNLVFVAAVSLVITSLYRMRVNLHKARATFYAEELKEWLTSEREADPASLQVQAGSTYCVNSALNLNTTFSQFTTGACNFNGIGNESPHIYRRRVTLTQTSPNQLTAHIEVSWNEAKPNGAMQQYDETLETIFTIW